MSRLRKFLALPIAEQALFFYVAVLLMTVRISLQVFRLQTVRRLLERHAGRALVRHETDPAVLRRLSRALAVVSRFLLGPDSCLVQALAARTLLARYGQPSRLRIGVTKDEDGKLLAHAWVESGGSVIIGGRGHSRYVPFLDLDG